LLDRASSTNSRRLFAGDDGFTVSTIWFETRLVTGTTS